MPITDVDIQLVCNARETVTSTGTGLAAAGGTTLEHYLFTTKVKLTTTTTPDVEAVSYQNSVLTAGARTIDLTALPTAGGTYDATGKKVRAFMVKNKTGNGVLTISEGATNGYALLGAGFTFRLAAEQQALFYLGDAAPAVASGDRTIDLAGTGTEQSEITIVIG